MKIKRFEDLKAWQEARILTKMAYDLTKQKDFSKDYRLRDQITGAAISTMNNTAEGFDSRLDREFVRFLGYARRSTSEVQTCLYVAIDQGYINQEQFDKVYKQAEKTRRVIDGFIRYLRK